MRPRTSDFQKMARFALRKTVCIIAAALAGAAVSPSPAFSADDETRAALAAEGETDILDAECVDISYPAFYQDLLSLTR